jgi:hypothetical protein
MITLDRRIPGLEPMAALAFQAARATGTTTVTCTGHYLANGTLIANISGTTITLDRPALNSATAMPVVSEDWSCNKVREAASSNGSTELPS